MFSMHCPSWIIGCASLLLIGQIGGLDYSSDLSVRNDALYDLIGRLNVIDVLESAISAENLQPIELRSADGDLYLCGLGDDLVEVEAAAAAAAASRAAPDDGGTDDEGARGADPLEALEGRCDILSLGWWSYEWCHRKHVTQFHLDQSAGVVDPEWSLGDYSHAVHPSTTTMSSSSSFSSSITTTASAASASSAKEVGGETGSGVNGGGGGGDGVGARTEAYIEPPRPGPWVEVFTDGQRCDETGAGRRTQVEFRCCAIESEEGAGATHPPLAKLVSIEEPALCDYAAVVCTSLACPPAEARGPDGGGGGGGSGGFPGGGNGKPPSALALVGELTGTCVTRLEGWWTYELCPGKHLRQYHVASVTDAKTGKQRSTVEAEFLLGASPPELAALTARAAKGDPTVDEAKFIVPPLPDAGFGGGGVLGGEGDGAHAPSTLELEYGGGTPCDVLGWPGAPDGTPSAPPRSATVQFVCAAAAMGTGRGGGGGALLSVVEERTCHYRAVVATPSLCGHPEFVHRKAPTRAVACRRQSPNMERFV